MNKREINVRQIICLFLALLLCMPLLGCSPVSAVEKAWPLPGARPTGDETWTETQREGPMYDYATPTLSEAEMVVYATVVEEKSFVNHIEYLNGRQETEHFRELTLDVHACLKGDAGDTLVVRERGGVEDGVFYISWNTPACKVGETYLLLLRNMVIPDSPWRKLAKSSDGTFRLYGSWIPEAYGRNTAADLVSLPVQEYLDIVQNTLAQQAAQEPEELPDSSAAQEPPTEPVFYSPLYYWERWSFEDMLEKCDRAVYGTVISKSETKVKEFRTVGSVRKDYYREVKLRVEGSLFGKVGRSVKYLEIGGEVDGVVYESWATAEVGDRVLVFLLPNGFPYFRPDLISQYEDESGKNFCFKKGTLPDSVTADSKQKEWIMTPEEYLEVLRDSGLPVDEKR